MKCTKCNSDKPVSLSIGDSAVSLASWCPDCGFTWTKWAAEEIATLQSQLAASKERERNGHRKCPCGGSPVLMKPGTWINHYCVCCDNEECQMSTEYFDTTDEAWAAWDGIA